MADRDNTKILAQQLASLEGRRALAKAIREAVDAHGERLLAKKEDLKKDDESQRTNPPRGSHGVIFHLRSSVHPGAEADLHSDLYDIAAREGGVGPFTHPGKPGVMYMFDHIAHAQKAMERVKSFTQGFDMEDHPVDASTYASPQPPIVRNPPRLTSIPGGGENPTHSTPPSLKIVKSEDLEKYEKPYEFPLINRIGDWFHDQTESGRRQKKLAGGVGRNKRDAEEEARRQASIAAYEVENKASAARAVASEKGRNFRTRARDETTRLFSDKTPVKKDEITAHTQSNHPALMQFLSGIPDHNTAHQEALDSWVGATDMGAPSPYITSSTETERIPPKAGGSVNWGTVLKTEDMAKTEDYLKISEANNRDKRTVTVGGKGAVLPDDKKSKKIDSEGSGGEIKKGKPLKKDGLPSNKPPKLSAPAVPAAKPPTQAGPAKPPTGTSAAKPPESILGKAERCAYCKKNEHAGDCK